MGQNYRHGTEWRKTTAIPHSHANFNCTMVCHDTELQKVICNVDILRLKENRLIHTILIHSRKTFEIDSAGRNDDFLFIESMKIKYY